MIDFAREIFKHQEIARVAWRRRYRRYRHKVNFLDFWVKRGSGIPIGSIHKLDLAQEYWDSL